MSSPEYLGLQESPPAAIAENGTPPALVLSLLSAAVDQFDFGIIVTDITGVVLLASSPGRIAMEEKRVPFAIGLDGRMIMRTRDAKAQINGALAKASRGLRTLMTVTGTGGEVDVHVSPINDGGALWIIGNPQGRNSLALELFAHAQDLTDAEKRVLRGLADGMSVKEVAVRNAVQISTIRSQLISIRHKTGTSSLKDLLTRVAALSPVPYGSDALGARAQRPDKLISDAFTSSEPSRDAISATDSIRTSSGSREDPDESMFGDLVAALTVDVIRTRELMQSALRRLESGVLMDPMRQFLESSHVQ